MQGYISRIIQQKLLFIVSFVFILTAFILMAPSQIIEAAKDGISLWFNTVFPSLFPFLVFTGILVGLGAVEFIGAFLEPVMRPLFKVPGTIAFPLVMGMISGYPMGAKIISDLRETKKINVLDAQRAICFCNNTGPGFIIGAVGVGMFGDSGLGAMLLISHYISAVLTGVIVGRIISSPTGLSVTQDGIGKRSVGTLKYAVRVMKKARRTDGRAIGALLGDSVNNAMEIILQIGGFIILFSVITQIMRLSGIFGGFDSQIAEGMLAGALEVTNGVKIISSGGVSSSDMLIKAAAVSFVIGWGGMSIHAQTISFIHKTGVSLWLYIASKLLHGALAAVVCGVVIMALG